MRGDEIAAKTTGMKQRTGFLWMLACMVLSAVAIRAEDTFPVSFGSSITRSIAALEYIFKLVIAPDGSIVGMELTLHNTSDTQAITLRGFIPPLYVGVFQEGKDGKSVKLTVPASKREKRIRQNRYVIEPGVRKEVFISIKEIIDPEVVGERLENCFIMTRLLLHPEGEPHTGIDVPTPSEIFHGCAFTAQGLKIDAAEAYRKLKSESK